LYVIRRTSSPAARLGAQEIPGPPGVEGLVIPPPPDEDSDAPGGFVSGFDLPLEQDVPQTQQTRERRELESIIAPGGQASQPTSRAAPPAQQRPFEPLVLDPETGQAVEARPRTQAVEPPGDRQHAAEPRPFEWEDVPELEFEQRVIRIDAEALQNGDPRQNIVIRERDYIRVPIDNRAYYLMGEVQRPGVYGFAGREISVKQALAAAGGFGPMAWPRRCEIIRRDPGSDRELTIPINLDAVFAGLEDDFYLRDGDILNVGTHFVAPFLFVIRNSFRFTYGFGFVYDRNFADKDAFGGRLNPEIRKAQERASRGLPF
jgi:polysaccharide export outer membrane protein